MVERRVVFDVKVEAQEGEAGENIARAALILMARSLLKADEDLDAAADADGWKFFVEALSDAERSTVRRNVFDEYCPFPGPPMKIIEPNNGGHELSGWPHYPLFGTVVWARQGTSNLGELYRYDGEGWRVITHAAWAEQERNKQTSISQTISRAVSTSPSYRSRVNLEYEMDQWARRKGKSASDWEATPPTTPRRRS